MAIPRDKFYYVYKIRNVTNGKVYIGQSGDPQRRYRQHRYKPVRRMATDVAASADYRATFQLTVLAGPLCKLHANHYEKLYITDYAATGAMGYNSLKGNPASTRRFWYLYKNNALRTRRRHTM